MKTTVNRHHFVRAFEVCGRKDQFTTSALFALFDYLEQWEDDTGEGIELDVIALCCEWAEYKSGIEAAGEYGTVFRDEETALEWLREETMVIGFDGGILVQNF